MSDRPVKGQRESNQGADRAIHAPLHIIILSNVVRNALPDKNDFKRVKYTMFCTGSGARIYVFIIHEEYWTLWPGVFTRVKNGAEEMRPICFS